MDTLLDLLSSLGINNTIWIQMGFFLISYLALSNLVFKPYMKAFEMRKANTEGGEAEAEEMLKQVEGLQEEYAVKAKAVSETYRKTFDAAKTETNKEFASKIQSAREDATKAADSVKEKVADQVKVARAEIDKQLPDVSVAVASKLIGKELSQ